MVPHVLAVIPGFIPSVELYVNRPLLELHRRGLIIANFVMFDCCVERAVMQADILVFCRNSLLEDLRTLYWAKKYGKKIIYDIDDNFFEISLLTHLGIAHRAPHKLYVLRKIIQKADIVRTYSPSLAQELSRFSGKVTLLKAYFDLNLIAGLTKNANKSKIKIVYASGRGREDSLGYIFETALCKIAEKYKDLVEIDIMGNTSPAFAGLNNIKVNTARVSYDQFMKNFYCQGYDIGLAPLEESVFMKAKNNTKYRDYGACGIAGIYSDVSPYKECITHNSNGLLVENSPGAWFQAIEQLVTDADLRTTIQQNAFRDISENYSFESFLQVWAEMIDTVKNNISVKEDINYLPALRLLAIIDQETQDLSTRFLDFMNYCREFGSNVNVIHLPKCDDPLFNDADLGKKFDAIVFFNPTEKTVLDQLAQKAMTYITVDEDFIQGNVFCHNNAMTTVSVFRQKHDWSLPWVDMNFIHQAFNSLQYKRLIGDFDGKKWLYKKGYVSTWQELESVHREINESASIVNAYAQKIYFSLDSPAVKWAEFFEKITPTREPAGPPHFKILVRVFSQCKALMRKTALILGMKRLAAWNITNSLSTLSQWIKVK